MTSADARYDGHADWYDESFGALADSPGTIGLLRELLGPGDGRLCLDIACGTGIHAGELNEAGYRAIGLDLSADQLRVARSRVADLIRADAAASPIRTGSVTRALGMFFHTDVEDFAAVISETTRCLAVGGRFAYVGLHPCFIGPFCVRAAEAEENRLVFDPGYGSHRWTYRGSGGGVGLWARVGGHHKTLATFLNAFADAGLRLSRVIELDGGGTVLPRNIALAAERIAWPGR